MLYESVELCKLFYLSRLYFLSELPSNFLVRELLDSTSIALRLTTPTSFWGILEDNKFCLRKPTSPLSKNATVRLYPVLCYSASHLNPNLRPWNVCISPPRFQTISVEHGGLCRPESFCFWNQGEASQLSGPAWLEQRISAGL